MRPSACAVGSTGPLPQILHLEYGERCAATLFWKYAAWLAGLVSALLILSGGVGGYFAYRQSTIALEALQREKARSAANDIAAFIGRVDRALYSRGVASLPLFPGPAGTVPAASIIRTDTTAPVIALQDEWSVAITVAWLVRQPDNPSFRLWEVAGTGHVDRDMNALVQPIVGRDLMFPPLACAARLNEAPLRYIVDSAINKLNAWITDGEAPPHAPSFIEVAGGLIVRDSYGNARGGIRLPQLEVPIATLSGVGNAGPGSCPVGGITKPFDVQTISSLYPTHGSYASRFAQATNDLRRSGFLLNFDSNDAKRRAAQTSVGYDEP